MRRSLLAVSPSQLVRSFAPGLFALILAFTAACGASSLPAGVYTSQQYHFKVSYPSGWQANIEQHAGDPAPLILIITRTGSHTTSGSIISSLTIDVLNLSDIGGDQAAALLASNKTLTPVTISGQTAYRDQPTTQQGAGNESTTTVTHTDYFIIHSAYEYQLSLDALASDQSTLDTMVNSFTLI